MVIDKAKQIIIGWYRCPEGLVWKCLFCSPQIILTNGKRDSQFFSKILLISASISESTVTPECSINSRNCIFLWRSSFIVAINLSGGTVDKGVLGCSGLCCNSMAIFFFLVHFIIIKVQFSQIVSLHRRRQLSGPVILSAFKSTIFIQHFIFVLNKMLLAIFQISAYSFTYKILRNVISHLSDSRIEHRVAQILVNFHIGCRVAQDLNSFLLVACVKFGEPSDFSRVCSVKVMHRVLQFSYLSE